MTGPLSDRHLDEIEGFLDVWDAAPVHRTRYRDVISSQKSGDLEGGRKLRATTLRGLLAEIRRLREQRDHLVSGFDKLGDRMGEFAQAAQGERGRYAAENQRLREEADRLRAAWESAWAERNEARGLLHRFVDHEDDPCRFDHHGDCQEHGSSGPCQVAEARRLLGLDGAEGGAHGPAGGPSGPAATDETPDTGSGPQRPAPSLLFADEDDAVHHRSGGRAACGAPSDRVAGCVASVTCRDCHDVFRAPDTGSTK